MHIYSFRLFFRKFLQTWRPTTIKSCQITNSVIQVKYEKMKLQTAFNKQNVQGQKRSVFNVLQCTRFMWPKIITKVPSWEHFFKNIASSVIGHLVISGTHISHLLINRYCFKWTELFWPYKSQWYCFISGTFCWYIFLSGVDKQLFSKSAQLWEYSHFSNFVIYSSNWWLEELSKLFKFQTQLIFYGFLVLF